MSWGYQRVARGCQESVGLDEVGAGVGGDTTFAVGVHQKGVTSCSFRECGLRTLKRVPFPWGTFP